MKLHDNRAEKIRVHHRDLATIEVAKLQDK
jgi:hypothetical protein